MTPSWLDEFPARLAGLDSARQRRQRRVVVPDSGARLQWLLQKTRSHIFATAAPALLACALRASLQLIEHDEWRRAHLQGLIARLRTGLAAGLKGSSRQMSESQTAIQPLLIGRNDEALAVMEGLRACGVWGTRHSPAHRARGHGPAAHCTVGRPHQSRY